MEARRWGGSVAFVVPARFAREHKIAPGKRVRIRVLPKQITVADISGILAKEMKGMNIDWENLEKELDEGWHE